MQAVKEVLGGTDIEQIKEHAYKLVVQEYDNRVIAKRFVEVYERVRR